ncbi:hypothetical protein [Dysgonomonas sp. GY617]|uniref:hypothetical protein n=1 Tax=Dysgonomonas sp. GY617 TaxID=2780420 RepID=UPI0018844165|nr:hypothetical protein [Dysgonomonas sp. GY617]MBF0576598.1 hypothetical protein [Dysgonomonas sp. GY617]
MDKRANIAELVGQLFTGTSSGNAVFTAKVIDVIGVTCKIDYDGLELSDVRLLPTTTVDNNRVLLIPQKDSYVLVMADGGNLSNLWVARVETVEKIEITCGDISVVVDKSGVILNGGSLGGMVKVKDLTNKLNALENSINALKAVFLAWMPISQDGGAALKGAITQWSGQPITPTKLADIENKKVKQ